MRTKAVWAALLVAGSHFAVAQNAGTLEKARRSGQVVMGVRESSAPLSYTLGGEKFTGYHVELCERVLAAVLPQAPIAYATVTSQNRIPLLQNGTIDIECGSTSNTAARKQQVAFAVTTYVSEARFAVKATSGISSVEQLADKTVVTTTGTTLVQRLRKLAADKGLKFNVIYGRDHADSFLLLETGRADAFAMDDNTLAGLIANAKSPRDYQIVGKPLGVEPIAIMLRKDDTEFKKAIDQSIRKMIASGELEQLYGKCCLSGPHFDLGDHAIAVVQSRVHAFTQGTAVRDRLPVPRCEQEVVDLELPVAHDDLVAGGVTVQRLHMCHMDRAFGDFALAPHGQGHDEPHETKGYEQQGIERLAPTRLRSPHAHQPEHAGDRDADTNRHSEQDITADAVRPHRDVEYRVQLVHALLETPVHRTGYRLCTSDESHGPNPER